MDGTGPTTRYRSRAANRLAKAATRPGTRIKTTARVRSIVLLPPRVPEPDNQLLSSAFWFLSSGGNPVRCAAQRCGHRPGPDARRVQRVNHFNNGIYRPGRAANDTPERTKVNLWVDNGRRSVRRNCTTVPSTTTLLRALLVALGIDRAFGRFQSPSRRCTFLTHAQSGIRHGRRQWGRARSNQ